MALQSHEIVSHNICFATMTTSVPARRASVTMTTTTGSRMALLADYRWG
jgi:hypothetical protein